MQILFEESPEFFVIFLGLFLCHCVYIFQKLTFTDEQTSEKNQN